MNSKRQTILVAGIAIVLVALAVPAAAQKSDPRQVTGNVPLIEVVGQAKWQAIRAVQASKVRPLSPAQPETCVNGNPTVDPIACGSGVNGNLANTDCFLSDNSYYDVYSFSGTSGQQVTIDMSSAAFDTYLFLVDTSGSNTAAQDDDGGGGTNSRIVFTLNQTGTWFIVANAFDPNVFGAYTLNLVCSGGGGGGGGCVANSTTLCLNNNRFRVTVTFSTPQGQNGNGMAVPETIDTGMFWFFSANNIELIIKVVTGCPLNNRYWVFAGGLTNVAYTITVTDTQTGAVRTFSNPQGTPSQPVQATDAFLCP